MDDFRDSEHALRALLARASEGDTHAYEQFYMQTADTGLALARAQVAEPEVEAFVARLYVAAWENLSTFEALALGTSQWLDLLARRLSGRVD